MDATASTQPKLNIRKVTLFSHGVANFELKAQVENDATLHLSFPQRHMNDVLKTLTVVDTSTGNIGSISYEAPSQVDPDQPTLRLFNIAAFTSLLQSCQGARVIVQHRQEVSGKILGVETLPDKHGSSESPDVTAETKNLILLQDAFRVSAYDLSEIHSIRFVDEHIQKQLDRHMQLASNALRAKNSRSLTIVAKGSGPRSVLVNYAVENPVPKFTYRFLLKPTNDNEAESVTQRQIYMQGWAIVDNPMDEDLDDVDMTIVSGLPISFQHDLYGARFVQRPKEKVPTADGPGYNNPSLATFGVAQAMELEPLRGSGTRKRSHDSTVAPRMQLATKARRKSAEAKDVHCCYVENSEEEPDWQDLASSEGQHAQAAKTKEVGALYEYNVPVKVSIGARKSALVPLIMQEVEGSRVDVYSHKVRESNTLSAVQLRNSTGAVIEGGPASMYEGSLLVGEGMLKTCQPGGEQLVPYSVNLKCSAKMESEMWDGEVISMVAVKGCFRTKREKKYTTVYTFENNQTEKMELYVLHEMQEETKIDSVKLILRSMVGIGCADEGPKPESVKEGVARFKIFVPIGRTVTLEVGERRVQMSSYGIRSYCTEDRIAELITKGVVFEELRSKMKEVMELEGELSRVNDKIREYKEKKSSLEVAQGRYRKNLESLGGLHESNKFRDDALIGTMLKSLGSSEKKIEELEELMEEAKKERESVEKKVLKKIEEFGK